MGFIRFVLWSSFCIGLGVFISTYEVNGRTPLEQMQRAWRQHVQPSKLERLKSGLGDVLKDAGQAASQAAKSGYPTERHTTEERERLRRLISEPNEG